MTGFYFIKGNISEFQRRVEITLNALTPVVTLLGQVKQP
jgi:hypothetical protein